MTPDALPRERTSVDHLRLWRGGTMIPSFRAHVWDHLAAGPPIVGLFGKVREFTWDAPPADGCALRFRIAGFGGGRFMGHCLEFVEPERITIELTQQELAAEPLRTAKQWTASEIAEAAPVMPMIIVTHHLEDVMGHTRLMLELWTPDEREIFKNDLFMRTMMAVIGPMTYRRQIGKHLRTIRRATAK